MPLVARASKTVRNKNLLIVLLFIVFLGWFAFDGWYTYPTRNDRLVAKLKASQYLAAADRPVIDAWKKWAEETLESRKRMDGLVLAYKEKENLEGWKEVFDIAIQRWIVGGLILAAGGAVGWFFHCQRRRALADETTVSPAPGVVIPWDKITRVDNTRWKSAGLVDITYLTESGDLRQARFDDYVLDREPLLAILDQLAERAVKAEFIPKEDPSAAPSSGDSVNPPAESSGKSTMV